MQCENCGKIMASTTKFCPNCGHPTNNASEYYNAVTYKGYLGYIMDWSFMSRLFTGVTLSYIIPGIPMAILILIIMIFKPNILELISSPNNPYNILGYIAGFIVIIYFFLFISEWGLGLIDKWFTPKYNRHLTRHNPNLNQREIDQKALKHIKIISNIFRILVFIALGPHF